MRSSVVVIDAVISNVIIDLIICVDVAGWYMSKFALLVPTDEFVRVRFADDIHSLPSLYSQVFTTSLLTGGNCCLMKYLNLTIVLKLFSKFLFFFLKLLLLFWVLVNFGCFRFRLRKTARWWSGSEWINIIIYILGSVFRCKLWRGRNAETDC